MSQSIRNPVGLNVFGSALLRVAPDVAAIHFSVATTDEKPAAAFEQTRATAGDVREFLVGAEVDDVQASRITLAEEWDYSGGRRRRRGYTSRISFHVILDDLDRIEDVVCGSVDAGVNEIGSVEFQTRQLQQVRVKARQQAVAAARQKAEVYARAAGVSVGRILHIEDVNPDQLRGRESHVTREPEIDDEGPVTAFDPGAITVGAAVILCFSLNGD